MIKNKILKNIISLIVLFIPLAITLLVSSINKSKAIPIDESCHVSLKDIELSSNSSGIFLNGKMELYFDQWIITDKDKREDLTAIIDSNTPFNEIKDKDDKYLPSYGFASYAFYIDDMPSDINIVVMVTKINCAFNIFCDDTLLATSGTPSKSSDKNIVKDVITYKDVKQKGDKTRIVIETGYSNNGGLNSPLKINTYNNNNNNNRRFDQLFNIALAGFLFFCSTTLIILSLFTNDKKKIFIFILIAILIFIHWLFSTNGLIIISSAFYDINPLLNRVVSLLTISLSIVLLKVSKSRFDKIKDTAFLSTCTALSIVISLLGNYRLAFVFLSLLYFETVIKDLTSKEEISNKTLLVDITNSLLFGILTLELVLNSFDLLINDTLFLTVFILILCILGFSIFIANNILIQRREKRFIDVTKKNKKIQNDLFINNIKQNEIYNDLNCISALYHEDINSGDEMLDNFSTSLRYRINSFDNNLISIDDEINDLSRYLTFEDNRDKAETEVIYNISFDDYLLPPGTLRTLQQYIDMLDHKKLKSNIYEIDSSKFLNRIKLVIKDYRFTCDIDEQSDIIINIKERLFSSLKANISFVCDSKSTTTIITLKRRKR